MSSSNYNDEVKKMSKYTWLLDPGHGGIINGVYQTAGKRSPLLPDGRTFYEGVFNREVTRRLLALCEKANISATNLVDTDKDLSLRHRVTKANLIHKENQNSIYISIHANAFGNGVTFNSAHGLNVFYYHKSRTGKRLAQTLQSSLADITGLKDRGVLANDSWANFYVLRRTHMPAILSENGFMTNLEEVKKLLSCEMKDKVAEGHFAMIRKIEEDGHQ